ncbi:MAG: hypothetical protein LBG95_05110 [Treponema sp.]|jgi:hypothetical protein|nr:hypothetical protein [Treponema sp.]
MLYQEKKYWLVLFLILIVIIHAYGHGGENFEWIAISTFGLYDTNNLGVFPSFDVNSSFFIFNGGLNYKNTGNMDFNNLSAYLGLGIGSFIQLQAGFSTGGFSIRNRYDMQIGYLLLNFTEKYPYLGLITLSASIEKYFNNSQRNWYFGLGIGFSINYEWGVEAFSY